MKVKVNGFKHLFVGRVTRSPEADMVVITLYRDEDAIQLSDGDEFVTLYTEVDPWRPPDAARED